MMHPTPLEPLPKECHDKRLWIGNLDIHLNDIEKFDLLYHRSGALEGQPRGYAFVTFNSSSEALYAKNKLHGKKIGAKYVAVKWANSINVEDNDKTKAVPDIPALSGAKSSSSAGPGNTIEAIEAKLKMMEKSSVEPDFSEKPLLSIKPLSFPLKSATVSQTRGRFSSRKRPYNYNRKR